MTDYIKNLTGEKFLMMIEHKSDNIVNASLPKFKYSYQEHLNEPLKALGLTDAFDLADFSRMAPSENGLFISDVLHKAFIQVDEKGTKAGAVTEVMMANSAPIDIKTVILNRPFLFAIIDNETSLPLFIGTVMDPTQIN